MAVERVPRTSQQAATAYTRLSRWYDWLGKSSESPPITTGLRLLNAQPGEQALENGRVGIVSMSKACGARASNLIVKVYERAHHWLPALIDCRPIDVQTMLAAAGFHVELVQTRSMWGLPVEIVIARQGA